MRTFVILCTFTLTAVASPAQPFSSLDVGAGATASIFAPDLSPWWARGAGGDVSVRLPFYTGVLETGASLHYHAAKDSDVPPFGSAFVFAGWGMRSRHLATVQAYAGGRLGIYAMVFDEESQVRDLSPYESEMAVAPVIALQRQIGGGWSAYGEMQHLIVLTAGRLHLTYLTVGVRRTLAAPSRLTAFLE